MSAQNSTGIQTLLEAERQASIIVQKDRSKRVKDARDEAKQEIADYKASKEAEFKKFEAEHSRGNQAAEDEANKMADQYIAEIKAAGQKNREGVVQNLLKAVFDVRPVAPVKA
ncbi:V-type proton ATPase subunit G [Escovopsis weberi]|uniref:V-type proton ATPase subunit G n=1 Tax=Escovopsis weberi TaxID=150374 RepID=A0A0M8N4M4_ESCWE|nr:V-type proton ATPase subunit G [Escovopsis weberi]